MRYVLVYGLIAGAIVISVISATIVFDVPNHLQSEWFGYLVMLVALSLIFVGVKRYRDVERGGVIKFLPAFAVGLGIAVVAGLVYVAGWETYLANTRTDFMAEYARNMVDGLRARGASAAELAKAQADMDWAMEVYRHPLQRMAITFCEIFPVGLIVALVSAVLLRNPRVFPAKAVA